MSFTYDSTHSTNGQNLTAGQSTYSSTALGSGIPVGSVVCVAAVWANAGGFHTASITDNATGGSNTYAAATNTGDAGDGFLQFFNSIIAHSGATTLTMTWPGGNTGDFPGLYIDTFGVSGGTASLDSAGASQQQLALATGTAVSTGAFNPAPSATGLKWGAAFDLNPAPTITGVPSGYTFGQSGTGSTPSAGTPAAWVTVYNLSAASGATTLTWTHNAADPYQSGGMAFLITAAATGCTGSRLSLLGVGCGIGAAFWAGKKIEENPVLTRRGLIIPRRELLVPRRRGRRVKGLIKRCYRVAVKPFQNPEI